MKRDILTEVSYALDCASNVENTRKGKQDFPPRIATRASKEPRVCVPAEPPVITPSAARALLRLLMNATGEQTIPSTVRRLPQSSDEAGGEPG